MHSPAVGLTYKYIYTPATDEYYIVKVTHVNDVSARVSGVIVESSTHFAHRMGEINEYTILSDGHYWELVETPFNALDALSKLCKILSIDDA